MKSFQNISPSATYFALALFSMSIALFGSWILGGSILSIRAAAVDINESLFNKTIQQQTLVREMRAAELTKKHSATIDTFIVQKNKGVDFVASVESLARIAGIYMSIASMTQTRPSDNEPGRLSFSVRYSGAFDDCLRFVRLIETMSHSISISSVTFRQSKDRWDGAMTFDVLSFETSLQ